MAYKATIAIVCKGGLFTWSACLVCDGIAYASVILLPPQEEMQQSSSGGPPMTLTIVFVERKSKCDEVAEALNAEGVPSAALHGGLTQWEREAALKDFSEGKVKVLIATDVASRGLDVKGIGHVVNMDLPRTFEDYVHRIGEL